MSKEKMQAIASTVGEPLVLESIDRPEPGVGEVLIRVGAAGVNRPDLIQRAGKYPPPPGAPDTLGLEVAGWIDAVGEDAGEWKIGDPVIALLGGGGYAEYAVAHHGSVLPIPGDLSVVEAAGLPETVFTVWNNVFDISKLKAGEVFLVHGGASGIGTTAIQLAVAMGATVYATAGTDEKCRQCEALGATKCINYKTEDFEAVLKAEGGVDVILDMVGAPYFGKNTSILKDQGRLCYIAFLQGPKVESADLMRVMLKRLHITGSTLRIRSNGYKATLAESVRKKVWPMIENGAFKPQVDKVFPLSQANEAHAHMESGAHTGKIILEVAQK